MNKHVLGPQDMARWQMPAPGVGKLLVDLSRQALKSPHAKP
jgi:hypothetical protein